MTFRVALASLVFVTAMSVIAPGVCAGQAQVAPVSPARDARPAPVAGTAAIRGRVVAADTGQPLRRAQIRITFPGPGREPLNISTDADGRYEVTALPAGRYTINVTRSGYLPLRYGQRRPLEQGKPLELVDGQTVENIDFALPRMSVIRGRITDELGDPIAGVRVYALRMMYLNGLRQLVPNAQGLTDDAGEYRIGGLTPGTYIVRANPNDQWTIEVGGREEMMGYAPTFFPGTTQAAEARRIATALGSEVGNTNFSVIPGRAAKVSGTAFDSSGRPFSQVTLGQEVRGINFASFGGGNGGSATVGADGTFTIPNITPGEYKLTARSSPDAARGQDPEIAIVPVVVDGVDLEHLSVTGSSGGSVSGRIVADEGVTAKLPRVGITIAQTQIGQPDPMILGFYRNAGIAQVGADGTFKIANVFGPARMQFTLPDDWVVKAVRHDGRDLTDTPLDLKTGDVLTDLQVVVSDRPTRITGHIIERGKTASGDGTVILFAADPSKWFDRSRFVRAARPDQQGRYQITGVPPGEYFAAAIDYVEDGVWYDPEYLESLKTVAQKITIGEGQSQSLSLTAVMP